MSAEEVMSMVMKTSPDLPPSVIFATQADLYESHAEAMQTNTHEQYRLREEIDYASKELAKLEQDMLVAVIDEWAKTERKPNNADERKAETSRRLATSGPYLDAMRTKMEHTRALMIVQARYDYDRRMKRLAELQMEWLIANAGGK